MRYKKSILPNEMNSTYCPNQQFSITLPRKKLDLSSFTLYYTGNASISEHLISHDYIRTFNFPTQTAGNPSATPPVLPVSLVDTGANSLTITAHGLGGNGAYINVIYKTNGNPAIPPLVNNTRYIIRVITPNSIRVAVAQTVPPPYTPAYLTLGDTATGQHSFEILSDPKYRSIPRQFPRLSSCVLSDVQVSVGGKSVQHLTEYNTLRAILNDIQKETDDIDGTSTDSTQNVSLNANSYIVSSTKVLPQPRANGTVLTKYFDDNKRQFFVNNFLGFLGESSRFFDATDQEVTISFRLAPPNILYKGLPSDDYVSYTQTVSVADTTPYGFVTDYELYDIKATVDVLDDIPVIDTFVFRDYALEQGSYLQSNKKCTVSLSIDKPVDWVLGTFKQVDYLTSDTNLQLMHCNTNTTKFGSKIKTTLTIDDVNALAPKDLGFSYELSKLQKDPYVLNSSYWFSHQGDGIRFTQYKLNNYDLTPQMDMTMCYNETKRCFNTDFKRVPSILSFEADFFANAVRIDDNTNEYKQLEWQVEIDSSKSNSKGGVPMLFCCYTNNL